MSFSVERDVMLAALRQVADAVEARNTIPVLGNLLLVAEDGRLTVTGTNLDIEATARCAAAIEAPVRITAPKDKLLAAVSSLKPGEIVVALEDKRPALTVKQKRAVRTIPTLAASEFPNLKELDGAVTFEMPSKALGRLFEATAPAISTDEVRYYLNGVFLHRRDGDLVAASTDGHRMVRATMAAPAGSDALEDAIVPRRTVLMLRKLLDKTEVVVAIAATDKAIVFEFGETRIVSKLVEGTFPDYTRVIPAPADFGIEAARDALIEPLVAVGAVVNAEGDKIRSRAVAIDCVAEAPEIRAQDQAGAFASEPLDVTVTGKPFKFGVNQQYLVQIAGIFSEASKLTLSVADEAAPIRITADKDPDLLAVVMPMRV